jgi:hypothetical protein
MVVAQHRPFKMALLNVRSLSNKTFILNDFIFSAELDFMFLTCFESWLQPGDHCKLIELCPPDFDCISQPRVFGRGGGLVTVYKKQHKCTQIPWNVFSSFEVLLLKLGGPNPVILATFYRPPKPAGPFLSELSEFLSSLVLNHDRIVLCGDFNIHVDDLSNTLATDFLSITKS